ncbi:M1 family metallopeptidase [Agromyces sp. LHK192]|uniref:M1 family metallopeptidase n=1 Tax=Agromyces sp. LHK192 TaxID=2498704 RepID=UPI0013E2A69D|nr:M1 family metallopeptidase [Agromyces sp. LHK192]
MSTEPSGSPAPSGSREPFGGRGFRGRLVATIGVLAAAAAGLAVAGAVQGPKLQAATVDTTAVTEVAGSRVVLELNQAIDRVDGELRVEPVEPAELTVDDDRLVVEFERPLPYDTEFTVTVDGVVGAVQQTPATVSHRFTTADGELYTLARRSPDGESDAVLRGAVSGGGDAEAVLEAPRILTFAHAGGAVAAVTFEDDDTHALLIAGIGDEAQALSLPERGWVRSIAGSTTHPLIGFVLDGAVPPGTQTPPQYESALFTLDVSGQNAAPEPVLGIDGEPMRVLDWAFVPGTASIVVQDFDGAMFIVDALGLSPPSPLGSHQEMRGLLPGTTELIVADPDRGSIVDLETGESRENVLPSAELPENAYPGRVTQLTADGTHLLGVLLAVTAADGTVQAQSLLSLVSTSGTALRYTPADGSRMLGYCASPNGRLAAVETAPIDAASDGYPNAPASRDRLTTIIDVATGATVRVQTGGASDWCGAG